MCFTGSLQDWEQATGLCCSSSHHIWGSLSPPATSICCSLTCWNWPSCFHRTHSKPIVPWGSKSRSVSQSSLVKYLCHMRSEWQKVWTDQHWSVDWQLRNTGEKTEWTFCHRLRWLVLTGHLLPSRRPLEQTPTLWAGATAHATCCLHLFVSPPPFWTQMSPKVVNTCPSLSVGAWSFPSLAY